MPLHRQTFASNSPIRLGKLVILAVLVMFPIGCFIIRGTEFAPGFTEEAFRSIEIGDSKETVLKALGEPFRVVGDLFIYRYLDSRVNFAVNTNSHDVSVSTFLGQQTKSEKAYYEQIKTLEVLTQKLGKPDAILRANRGQHEDPNILTYIYSKEAGTIWEARAVYIHKKTDKVTGVFAESLTD